MEGAPHDTREEDRFPEANLDAYLRTRIEGLQGELEVKQFSGGVSNLVYLLSYGDRDFVLRTPPAGTKAKSAHNVLREARFIRQISSGFASVPEIFCICEDPEIMGRDFFVMEKLDGVILRQDFPEGLLPTPDEKRALAFNFVDSLLDLHKVDTGLVSDFARGDGYVRRQVGGWSRRYKKAITEDVPDFARVISWLEKNQPEDVAQVVIHNDYRLDNLVLNRDDPSTIVGVLDWEMATVGDPLMDLGGSLAYWVQADDDPPFMKIRIQPTHAEGMPTRQEVIDYYFEKSNLPQSDFLFYEVFGLFRLAVIAQQVYYRYYHGQTTNKRFATLDSAVTYLEKRCSELVGSRSF